MIRLVVAVCLTVVVVTFGMMNTHHVQLSPVVGEPVSIRLIFLLALAVTTGSLGTIFYQMVSRAFSSRRGRLQISKTRGRSPQLELE